MEFSRPEYWSGLLFPSPGDLPNPGIEPRSLALQTDSLPPEPPGKPKADKDKKKKQKKNTTTKTIENRINQINCQGRAMQASEEPVESYRIYMSFPGKAVGLGVLDRKKGHI